MKMKVDVGSVVLRNNTIGVFKVQELSSDGKTANIQQFDVSRKKLLGIVYPRVPIKELAVYREDDYKTAATEAW